jgi:hypothetical protein
MFFLAGVSGWVTDHRVDAEVLAHIVELVTEFGVVVDLVFVSRGELGEVVLELGVDLFEALGLLGGHLLAAFGLLLLFFLFGEECCFATIHMIL